MLPYKIDNQKYVFKEYIKDALALSIYNFQLTLCDKSADNDEVKTIIQSLQKLEKELNDNVNKLPENYELHRGAIKQLIFKLKELYTDNIDQHQLKNMFLKVYQSFKTGDEISYEEVHQKLRSLSNS